MNLSCWAVARGPRAARWERLWLALGASPRRASRLDELSAGAGPRARGVALVDLELLAPRSTAALAALRARSPGLHVVACAAEGTAPEALATALSAGALDFFQEAADDDVLGTRLLAHLKRLFPRALPFGRLAAGGLHVDVRAREVRLGAARGARAVRGLSAREFDVLAVLAGAPGRPFERARLAEAVGDDATPDAVDKAVAGLRRKLGRAGRAIRTVRGVGYLLEPR